MSRRLPPLSTLRAFDAAARLGSFSRAADSINVTPSAVSHQVRSLEQFLGVALFLRDKRRQVSLTSEGRFFAGRLDEALKLIGDAAAALRSKPKNRLAISVLPSFAARWLTPRIGGFLARSPELDFHLRSGTAHADFIQDEIDIAIRFGPGQWVDLQAEWLMHDELFPVASAALLKKSPPRRVSDLQRLPWLQSDPESWERWFAAAGAALPKEKRRLEFGDASLALQAAIDGAGIAMTRRSIAHDELKKGSLVRLFPTVSALSQYSYYFVWPDNATLSQNAMAFREWLIAEVKKSLG